jgi:predicted ester cyclase
MDGQQERNVRVVLDFIRLIDEHKNSEAFKLVAEDVVVYVGGEPQPKDKAYWVVAENAYTEGFSNGKHAIEHVATQGNLVSVHCVYTATHTGGFMGIPATGKQIRIVLMLWARIVEDRIAEFWCVGDTLHLCWNQLGVIPAQVLGVVPAAPPHAT